MKNRIVYVGQDRQLYLVGPDGEQTLQLTSAVPRSGGPWAMLGRSQEVWTCPTWTQDGTEIAAFCTESGDDRVGPVRLVTMSLDGVRQEEWASIQDGTPLYLQWHPSGQILSLLMQQGNELMLAIVDRANPGAILPVETGVPLFYTWHPEGHQLFVHAGGRRNHTGRLVTRDPLGSAEDQVLDVSPGNFCTPLYQAGANIYARRAEGESELVAETDGDVRVLASRSGLLAVIGAPGNAPLLALSSAPTGEGSPYHGLELVNLKTGDVRSLCDAPIFAFFWSPTGDFLVFVQVDSQNNCLQWYRVSVDGGAPVALGTFWPTRDLLFYLHFFDQYAMSHPNVSADGRFLVYAGYPAGNGQADLSGKPCIYVQELAHPERQAIEVGNGSFAVFGPN